MRSSISACEITNESIANDHLPDSDALETISFNLSKKDMQDFIAWSSKVYEFVTANLNTGDITWIFTPDAVNTYNYAMDYFWLEVTSDF